MLAEKGALCPFSLLLAICVAASCTPAVGRVPDDASLVRAELQKPHDFNKFFITINNDTFLVKMHYSKRRLFKKHTITFFAFP